MPDGEFCNQNTCGITDSKAPPTGHADKVSVINDKFLRFEGTFFACNVLDAERTRPFVARTIESRIAALAV